MKLAQSEIELFFRLMHALAWGVNEKYHIVPTFEIPVYGEIIDREPIITVRAEMWDNPSMIDECFRDNVFGDLTEKEREILADWRERYIKGRFIILKHLAKYSVFLPFNDSESPEKLYGVCGISDSVKETVPFTLPVMAEAILLPFNGKIIYDGFFGFYRVSFGKGIRSTFIESYNTIKAASGIVDSMDVPPVPTKSPVMKEKPPQPVSAAVDTKGANVPKGMSARYMEIAGMIEAFCDENLDGEFKEICLRALAKLCRKRSSPTVSGKARTWACGIVYAIGSINFIFDRSQPYYMTGAEIAEWFGLSKSTAGSKSAEINRLLNLSYFDSEFSLQRIIEKNPMRRVFR
jgi:hypothetical protein